MRILRNICAVLMGILIGSMLNMGLINFGMKLFPLPEGINISTEENFKNAFSYFELKHFIFPFLGHAIGTFAGAFVCMLLSKPKKLILPMIIGGVFLIGGLSMILMVNSPIWFTLLDLTIAYIPMAYLAYVLLKNKKKSQEL